MRSLATREAVSREISAALARRIAACRPRLGLIVLEDRGDRPGRRAIVELSDVALYVMTPDFGSASSSRRSTCLDFADFVGDPQFRPQAPKTRWRDGAAGAAEQGGVRRIVRLDAGDPAHCFRASTTMA